MTPELLTKIGEALYGSHWQSDLARALAERRGKHVGTQRRQLVRWASGQNEIPEGFGNELKELCAERGEELIELSATL
jgi:hypothetical protein